MKKIYTAVILGMLTVSLIGCGNPCQEDALSKIGDSIATLGKKGMDKDKVLAERKAGRAAKCAEKKAAEMKKSLGF